MSITKDPELNKGASQKTIGIQHFGLGIFSILSILGLYQIVVGRLEDGLTNLIIGTSLSFTLIPFDYPKAPVWQKALVWVYLTFLLAGIAYLLINDFSR